MQKEILKRIWQKKQILQKHQPLTKEIEKNLLEWIRIELTYNSNAIEGNTLTRQQTMLVVEKNLSIAGKKVNEIFETKNHDKALSFIYDLIKNKKITELKERDILNIHEIILSGIDNTNAGRYRNVSVRTSGSRMIPPNPVKINDLMKEFFNWLTSTSEDQIKIACDTHYKLVSIHPFVDGNGRTARLFFNLILLIAGFPCVFIKIEDREEYLNSLEKAQLGGSMDDYYLLMFKSIEYVLDIYLDSYNLNIE